MSEQQENLRRVREKIAESVMAFYLARGCGNSFHMKELADFVKSEVVDIAPDSPSRILRLLRQEGRLDYTVLSRKGSLYQFV